MKNDPFWSAPFSGVLLFLGEKYNKFENHSQIIAQTNSFVKAFIERNKKEPPFKRFPKSIYKTARLR